MRISSRRKCSVVGAVALAATLLVPGGALAQGGGSDGRVGGSAGEYSDLVVALRDVDGLPILRDFEVIGEDGTTTEHCVQPVASEQLPGLTETVTNEVDGREVYPIPLVGDLGEASASEEEVEVCDPQPAYAMYVAEAELERLNMARTKEDVIERKLQDVTERLLVADTVTLDGAGRLVIDGEVVDAGPENAALFQELMDTGTLPTLDPAVVPPFGPWELSAASVGAAASKFTPISIDAVLYYNRITDAAQSDGWRADPLVLEETGEEFVNYRGFSYTRADVFTGGVTWLDVPTLTWKTSRILDVVDFAPLPPNAVGGTLENAAGYAQLVDDVRAAILYFHEYEALSGFYMDPVGVDTYDEQVAALTAPAVRVADVPAQVVQSETFSASATVFNPWAGALIADVRPRVKIETAGGFTADDASRVTATEVASGDPVTFELEGDALVGYLEPAPGIAVAPGYNVTTALELRVSPGAPIALYDLQVEMTKGPDVLASASTSVDVLAPELTALWTSADRYVEQAAYAELVTRTFNPVGGGSVAGAQLQLTVDPLAEGGFVAGAPQAVLYSEAVSIPLTLNGEGQLQGQLTLPEVAEETSIETAWYLVVAEGAPIGWYDLSVQVLGAAAPQTVGMYVAPAPIHGPVDTTAPKRPTAVAAVAGDASAEVSWTPAADGATASGYVVTSSPGALTCVAWGASATDCTVGSLTNGVSYTFTVKAVGEGGFSSSSAPSAPVIPHRSGEAYTAMVSPVRVLDSRSGTGGFDTPWGPRTTRTLQMVGTAGIPADATAVVLNLTATGATEATHITAWASDEGKPRASNLNLGAGQTRPNLVTVPLSATGSIDLFNNSGSVDLVADAVGYFRPTSGLHLTTVSPSRILDSRDGTGGFSTEWGPGTERQVQVTGVAGIPAEAEAVVVNLTGVSPTAATHLTAWPTGETRPRTSNLNLAAGEVAANLAVVKIGASGQISLFNNSGEVDVVGDVVGYYQTIEDGGRFNPIHPTRVLDTHDGTGGFDSPWGPGMTRELDVRSLGDLPAGATSVVVNLTAAAPTAATHLTAWPTGTTKPTASNLNLVAGDTRANLVVASIGDDGRVSLYNNSGSTHLIADLVGYYTEPVT